MSQSKSGAAAGQAFAESDIVDYLRSHPDFFERHPNLLLGLRLPHRAGAAVSLVERQVAMLRQRNAELERQLTDLVAVAKHNNDLVEQIHSLSVRLMSVATAAERIEALEVSLREDFGSEQAVLVLFPREPGAALPRAGFVLGIERDDPALKPFSAFLRSARPRCGALRDRQRELLFPRETDGIVSAAMVPLGQDASQGFLVIGSRDPDYFNPGQRMDFLGRIGELVSVALRE